MKRVCVVVLAVVSTILAPAQRAPTTAKPHPPDLPDSPSLQTRPAGMPKRETVDAFLRKMFGWDKTAQWRVVDIRPSEVPNVAEVVVALGGEQRARRMYIMPGGEWAILGDVIPFGADPYANIRIKLNAEANGPSLGPKQSDLTIVEFSDLQCPNCKTAQPMMDSLAKDFPQAHIVFQNFPLAQIHPWAFEAAAFGTCIAEQSNPAFWKYVNQVYEKQAEITPETSTQKLTEIATAAGADGAKTAACAKSPEAKKRVDASFELGRTVGVTGTPTLFVNGRKLAGFGSIPYETLKAIVDFDSQQAAQPAGK